MTDQKQLHFTPDPDAGYTVARREDGGMNLTFTHINEHTLEHWRDFSAEHLLGSDRLTRNLYDLRRVERISERALKYAVELNSDPSTRNIRLAVVVADDMVRVAVQKIADLTPGGGARMAIFTDLGEAEAWLARPMESMI
ncbi:MAG: STAS/SEC14 domain-containing protein [Chloroflexi bacterium]|jgi:hypothetical protein|nr:STAS/SEC14 domain-containing protein [Chloroflexota bacterium]